MKLLLTVCLTCALLYTAASLNCHVCDNETCTNSTSVSCPASTMCRTVTSVSWSNTSMSVRVIKECSSLLVCATPLNTETEWSVNMGFVREAHIQMCCMRDNCNLLTLATPSSFVNGKHCPACVSPADSLAGTCNATLSCAGVEDTCFSGTDSTDVLQLGCISNNICTFQATIEAAFGAEAKISCGAPWSVRISAALLTFALTAHKVLV